MELLFKKLKDHICMVSLSIFIAFYFFLGLYSCTYLPELFLLFFALLALGRITVSYFGWFSNSTDGKVSNDNRFGPIFDMQFDMVSALGVILLLLALQIVSIFLGFENQSNQLNDFLFWEFSLNGFVQLIKFTLVFFGILILLSGKFYSNSFLSFGINNEFSFFFLIMIFSFMFILSCSDLLSFYVCFELQSMAIYSLLGIGKRSLRSVEANLKYFIISSISSIVFLLGVFYVYLNFGTIFFADLDKILMMDSRDGLNIRHVGFVGLVGPVFLKLCVVPFHAWIPDVFEGSDPMVAMVLAIMPKVCFMGFLINFWYTYDFLGAWLFSSHAVFIFFLAMISVLVGSLGGLAQSNLKRLLAYSTISHMGFFLFGLGLKNTALNLVSLFVYLFGYSILTFAMFLVLLNIKKNNLPVENLEDFCQASKDDIVFGSISILFFFSLIGIPPLLGFWIKFRVITSLFAAGFVLIGMVVLFLNIFSIFYYLRIIKTICFGDDNVGGDYSYPSGSNLFYDIAIIFCFLNVFGFVIFDCFEFFLMFLFDRIL